MQSLDAGGISETNYDNTLQKNVGVLLRNRRCLHCEQKHCKLRCKPKYDARDVTQCSQVGCDWLTFVSRDHSAYRDSGMHCGHVTVAGMHCHRRRDTVLFIHILEVFLFNPGKAGICL